MAGARTFDHDEAKRLIAAGHRRKDVAEMLGVSEGAVQWATTQPRQWWNRFYFRMPPDLKRALERQAKAEGRSLNSQLIKMLQEAVDWHWYEETEDCEQIFAHPVSRHIRRVA